MLTFANPAFLFALAGLAVPIIAHLINRERAQPLKFPSIRYIQRARLPQEGKRSIRDLLLLLLRLLLYAAVIVALAGPRWEAVTPDGESDVAQVAKRQVFVVDASASMSGWGSWERAQGLFKEALKQVDSETVVGLVLFANDVIESIKPSTNVGLIQDIVSSELPRPFRGKPVLAMKEAIAQVGNKTGSKIVIISDFQNSNWQASHWPALSPNVEVEFLSVDSFEQVNIGMLTARAYPASKNRIRVITRIRNFSDEEQTVEVTLTTSTDVFTESLKIAPMRTQPLDFFIARPEDLAGRLSIGEDAFAADNDYALWLGPPPPIRVMSVLPVSEEPEKLREVEFVQNALSVTSEVISDHYSIRAVNTDVNLGAAGLIPEEILQNAAAQSAGILDGTEGAEFLPKIDIAYVAGAGAYLVEEQWQDIKTFVDAGGLLMITPGKNAHKQFRELREHEMSGIAYLGQPSRQRDRRNPYRIGWLNPKSILNEIFTEDSLKDLYLTELYQYIRLRPGQNTEVILKTESGDPLLLRERYGKGSILVSAFSWDSHGSDLPLRNSFLPLLRELLDEAGSSDGGIIRIECGDVIPPGIAANAMDTIAVAVEQYTAQPNVFNLYGNPLEINVARDESLPRKIVLTDLRSAFYQQTQALELNQASTADAADPDEYWSIFALFALAILFFETLIATWLDNRLNTSYA